MDGLLFQSLLLYCYLHPLRLALWWITHSLSKQDQTSYNNQHGTFLCKMKMKIIKAECCTKKVDKRHCFQPSQSMFNFSEYVRNDHYLPTYLLINSMLTPFCFVVVAAAAADWKKFVLHLHDLQNHKLYFLRYIIAKSEFFVLWVLHTLMWKGLVVLRLRRRRLYIYCTALSTIYMGKTCLVYMDNE